MYKEENIKQKPVVTFYEGFKSEAEIRTVEELSKFCSATKRTIDNWKEEGTLPFSSIGSRTFVTSLRLAESLKEKKLNLINHGGYSYVTS